jgi:hypothetical protein
MDSAEIVLFQLGLGCTLLSRLVLGDSSLSKECHSFDFDRIDGIEFRTMVSAI